MDPLTLVAHAIWAAVALCAIGAVLYVWYQTSLDSNALEALWTNSGDLRTTTQNLSLEQARQTMSIVSLNKEVETIRDGLEKLKAIPPKAPRF